jgi:hypothetical protein
MKKCDYCGRENEAGMSFCPGCGTNLACAENRASPMDDNTRETWGSVRERGRDRFLLKSIGRAAWIYGILFVLLHVGLWLFTREPVGSAWELFAEWAFMSVGLGAMLGSMKWQDNEKSYQESVGGEKRP